MLLRTRCVASPTDALSLSLPQVLLYTLMLVDRYPDAVPTPRALLPNQQQQQQRQQQQQQQLSSSSSSGSSSSRSKTEEEADRNSRPTSVVVSTLLCVSFSKTLFVNFEKLISNFIERPI